MCLHLFLEINEQHFSSDIVYLRSVQSQIMWNYMLILRSNRQDLTYITTQLLPRRNNPHLHLKITTSTSILSAILCCDSFFFFSCTVSATAKETLKKKQQWRERLMSWMFKHTANISRSSEGEQQQRRAASSLPDSKDTNPALDLLSFITRGATMHHEVAWQRGYRWRYDQPKQTEGKVLRYKT